MVLGREGRAELWLREWTVWDNRGAAANLIRGLSLFISLSAHGLVGGHARGTRGNREERRNSARGPGESGHADHAGLGSPHPSLPCPLPSLGTLAAPSVSRKWFGKCPGPQSSVLCPRGCGLALHSSAAIASQSFTRSLIQQICIKYLLCAGDIMVMGSDFWWSGPRKSGEATLEQGAE